MAQRLTVIAKVVGSIPTRGINYFSIPRSGQGMTWCQTAPMSATREKFEKSFYLL